VDLGNPIGFDTPRALNFDIEVRPLGWYGGDWVHKEITVIACAWEDDPAGTLEVYSLTLRRSSMAKMRKAFVRRYNEAGLVTGHFIRGFDLGLINMQLFEEGLPGLTEKMTHDTKGDLLKVSGISKSQENLASWLGIPTPKVSMSMEDWRRANRLSPEGIELAVERAGGDVLQNCEMRKELLRRGLLGPPKLWTPGDTPGEYHA
jgi:hypothetical protein